MDPRLAHQELISNFAIHDFSPKQEKERALTGDFLCVEGSDQSGCLFRRPGKLVHFLFQHFDGWKLLFLRVDHWACLCVQCLTVERDSKHERFLGNLGIQPLHQRHVLEEIE